MIVRTEAIVLHALDYSETSQIVSLLTRQQGRTTVMARGARRPKSRFGSALQPMSYVEVIYYHRPGRELQTLKEASHSRRLRFLVDDVVKLSVGFRMVELVRALTEPGDPQPTLFNALLQALIQLDAAPTRATHVLPHFQLRLAGSLGFAPRIDKPDVLELSEKGAFFDPAVGAVRPQPGPQALRASRGALRALAVFARADLATALRMRLRPEVLDEVLVLIDAYLRHHVPGRYPDRAAVVGQQLRRGFAASGNA